MLCKKTNKPFDLELFKNPTNQYRGVPFWSWNGKLEKERLEHQIDCFNNMGFGGFFMHSRRGLATEYLSDEYFDCINTCIKAAKQNSMNACLYDEDRWPSGFAGGLVTKIPKYRQRFLCVTENQEALPELEYNIEKGLNDGTPYFIACFDIDFDQEGYLKSYKKINPTDSAQFHKFYFYSRTEATAGKYNFQTNVDLMQPEAIKEFINVTHSRYYERFAEEYGKAIPTIFSDEPRQGPQEQLKEDGKSTGVYHWTYNLPLSFKEKYGYDITDHLPKLVWDKKGTHSFERYDFFNHTTSLFEEAFFKQIHNTVNEQGISFCGHLMLEDELLGQLNWGGDIMRLYPNFDIPGIDMLFDYIEFITAKQTQSVVRQYNKEAMLSELFGVTGWDYDFKALKVQGDWQAAMGVSVRVPHLSMYSMKGAAKRDYPQSFNYQVPWYKEMKFLEDHYARLNTVLSRGTDLVNVAIVHPFETVMLSYSTKEKSFNDIKAQEESLQSIVRKMLYSNIDFDFLNEALLPTQKTNVGEKFTVGNMSYSAIIIPPVKTLRKTTVNLLESFIKQGGKVLFMGDCPQYLDGKKSDKIQQLYNSSTKVGLENLITNLEDLREVKISCNGIENKKIYRLIEDSDCKWLFAAHAERIGKTDSQRRITIPQNTVIEIKGEYGVTLYDTVKGEIKLCNYEIKNGKTYIYYDWYANDCLLARLTDKLCEKSKPKSNNIPYKTIKIENATYKRHEDNCIVLDMCETSIDGKNYSPKKYVLEQSVNLSRELGFYIVEAQPYYYKAPKQYPVFTRYNFTCKEKLNLKLALERLDEAKIIFNGVDIGNKADGFYVDNDIPTISLGDSVIGNNTLEILIPINGIFQLEPLYILGDFISHIENDEIIISKPKTNIITFEPLNKQGFNFYGGNISYDFEIETENCTAEIAVDNFAAPCIKAFVDGKEQELIALSPFTVKTKLQKGKHQIKLLCYGNRNNTFGPIHNRRISDSNYYIVPNSWSHLLDEFTEEFCFQDVGILSSPIIKLYK